MARLLRAGEKPLLWVGSSKEDLLRFPEPVKDNIGAAFEPRSIWRQASGGETVEGRWAGCV